MSPFQIWLVKRRLGVGRVVHKRDCICQVFRSAWYHFPCLKSSYFTLSFNMWISVDGMIGTNAAHGQMANGIIIITRYHLLCLPFDNLQHDDWASTLITHKHSRQKKKITYYFPWGTLLQSYWGLPVCPVTIRPVCPVTIRPVCPVTILSMDSILAMS